MKSRWRFFLPLFLALFFLSLLSSGKRRAPWYEQWVLNFFSPLTKVFSSAVHGTGDIWHHYIWFVGLSEEVEDLRRNNEALRQKLVISNELQKENIRLHSLLSLKQNYFPEGVAAKVVGLDPFAEYKSLRINKGSKDGIAADMPVVAGAGLVGKIGPVFKKEAVVLLIADPASHIDVVVSRSRLRALLTGVGSSKTVEVRPSFLTRLEYLKNTSDIQASDWVVTSGLDGLFPKGILVGEVSKVKKDPHGIFLTAHVAPAVDFGGLEEVLVLKRVESP